MRIKRSRIKPLYFFQRTIEKDSEGGTKEKYPEAGIELAGESWPASGKLQAEQYGDRLKYIRNVRLNGKYDTAEENGRVVYRLHGGAVLQEGDALGIDMNRPQYRILSVKPYRFLRMEVEMMVK